MTRIVVPRGSSSGGGSANPNPNPNRSSAPGPSSSRVEPLVSTLQQPGLKEEETGEDKQEQAVIGELLDSGSCENKIVKSDDILIESSHSDQKESLEDEPSGDNEKAVKEDIDMDQGERTLVSGPLQFVERSTGEVECLKGDSSRTVSGNSPPPPPPVPPVKTFSGNSNSRRHVSGSPNAVRMGSSGRGIRWPIVSTRTSPSGSRPSSPRSHVDLEGYNSADEQNSCFVSSYYDLERERQFEVDIKRVKGFELRKMVEDGNCLFRAVADQVYGDSEVYDLVRQMCLDYMERERDHFSQFITEGFATYCQRKRTDKVYGNNAEIQAISEMYNRPIHIFSYSTEPINIFHGYYNTDLPPIRLSYHQGNHYNSLVDPRRLSIGAGLGFSSLQGADVDKDQVKAALKAQQDQQIDNALLAEGRYYSDLELTEKEIEQMVMDASRAEYLASNSLKQQLNRRDSSTSGAEPSSSGARSSRNECKVEGGTESGSEKLSSSMQIVLSMGFSYFQVIEAFRIFGDDVDSVVNYLLETGNSGRRKGKATEK